VWPIGVALYRATIMVSNGVEAMVYTAVNTAIFHSLALLLVALALMFDQPLSIILIVWAMSSPLAGVINVIVLRPEARRQGVRLRPRLLAPRRLLELVLQAAPYSIPKIAVFALTPVMCLLTAVLGAREEMASFVQICFSLAMVAHLIAAPLSVALFPVMVRYISEETAAGHDRAEELLRLGLRLLSIVAVASVAGFWVAGDELLAFFGSAYVTHHMTLIILAVAMGLEVYRSLIDQLLMGSRFVAWVAWWEAVRYAITIVAAWLLIPEYGTEGAAWAVMVGAIANWIFKLFAIHRCMRIALWRDAVATFVLVALVSAVPMQIDMPWVSVLIFAVGAPLFRLFRWSDVKSWKALN
jgi:O-antigen/teichoic acid export membrane protein